jgi:hypothetical protein
MVKVSREEFAEVLYYWVMKDLREKKIKETASSLQFEIKSDEDYDTVFRELLILNMYLAVTAAERVFEDEEKRNGCLDLLHRLVFDRHYGETGVTFGDWMIWMGTRYLEYQQALESDSKHPPGPLWEISKMVNKRLFGEIKEDPFIQASIGEHIVLNLKHLTHLICEYDIE